MFSKSILALLEATVVVFVVCFVVVDIVVVVNPFRYEGAF